MRWTPGVLGRDFSGLEGFLFLQHHSSVFRDIGVVEIYSWFVIIICEYF